jgi:hypothetical protein
MTKLPKIEVWNIDPDELRSYERWVMTSDRVVVKVSPSWHWNDQLTADHVLGMTVDMLRLIYTVERDNRTSDS